MRCEKEREKEMKRALKANAENRRERENAYSAQQPTRSRFSASSDGGNPFRRPPVHPAFTRNRVHRSSVTHAANPKRDAASHTHTHTHVR